jgi:hypothetical protein
MTRRPWALDDKLRGVAPGARDQPPRAPCPYRPGGRLADGGPHCDGSGWLADERVRAAAPCRCRPLIVARHDRHRLNGWPVPASRAGLSLSRLEGIRAEVAPAAWRAVEAYVTGLADRLRDGGSGLWLVNLAPPRARDAGADPAPDAVYRPRPFAPDPADREGRDDAALDRALQAAAHADGDEEAVAATPLPDHGATLIATVAAEAQRRRQRVALLGYGQMMRWLVEADRLTSRGFYRRLEHLCEVDLLAVYDFDLATWDDKEPGQLAWLREQVSLIALERDRERRPLLLASRRATPTELLARLGDDVFERVVRVAGEPLPTNPVRAR